MYLPHGLRWPLFDWARLVGCFSSFELWLCLFGKLSAQGRSVELNILISVIRCLSFHNTKHLGALSTSSRPYRLRLCPVSFVPQDQASPFVHARRRGLHFVLLMPSYAISCHLMSSHAISCHLVSHGLHLSGLAPAFFPLPSSCQYRMDADQQLLCFSVPCFHLFSPSFWFYIALSYFGLFWWLILVSNLLLQVLLYESFIII